MGLGEWIRDRIREEPAPRPAPEIIILPVSPKTSKKEYMGILGRILATVDGKALLLVFQEKYLGALAMRCPPEYVTNDQKCAWLAAHDMLIATRWELLDDLTKNVDKVSDPEKAEGLPAVRGARSSGDFEL